MANNSLQRFDNDGIELVIDIATGEAFATPSGYARMGNLTRDAVYKRFSRGYQGVDKSALKSAQIQTPGGLQGVDIIPADIVFDWLWDDNPPLAKAMGKAGATLYLQQLAGYKHQLVAPQQQSKVLQPEQTAAQDKVLFAQQQYEFWEKRGNVRMMARFETMIAQTSDAYLLEEAKQLLSAGQPIANTHHKQYEGVVDVVIRLQLPWNSRFESSLGRHVGKLHSDLRIRFDDLPQEVKDYRLSSASGKEIPSYMYPAYNEVVEDCVTQFCKQKQHDGWRTQKELKAMQKLDKAA